MGGTITAKGAKGTTCSIIHTRWRKDGRPFVRDGVTLENELRDFANCNRGPGKQSVYICSDLREFVKEGKRLPPFLSAPLSFEAEIFDLVCILFREVWNAVITFIVPFARLSGGPPLRFECCH